MSVIIVTGASRGLGAAVARCLAKARAAVTLISRSENRLRDVAEEVRSLGGQPLVYAADVSNSDACRSAMPAEVPLSEHWTNMVKLMPW